MIILAQNENKQLDNRRYSIVNLTVAEFFAINRALERQCLVSADLDKHEYNDVMCEINVKTKQSFKTAFCNRIKID